MRARPAPRGLDDLAEAVDVLGSSAAAVDLARAQTLLACRPEVGDERAVPLLRAASVAAGRRGAQGIRRRALTELERRGARAEDSEVVAEALSRTERQILALTRAGLDAQAVAQRLLVTPGTVRDVLAEAGLDATPWTLPRDRAAVGSGVSQVDSARLASHLKGGPR